MFMVQGPFLLCHAHLSWDQCVSTITAVPAELTYCGVSAVCVLKVHVCCQPDLVVDPMLLLPLKVQANL